MKALSFVMVSVLLGAGAVSAQETWPRFEVGVKTGAQGVTGGGLDSWVVAVHALDQTALFVGVRLGAHTQLSGDVGVATGAGSTTVSVSADVARLVAGGGPVAPYLFAGFATSVGTGRDTRERGDLGLGVGAGFRIRLLSNLTLAPEVVYRRWLRADADQFGLRLKLGWGFGPGG